MSRSEELSGGLGVGLIGMGVAFACQQVFVFSIMYYLSGTTVCWVLFYSVMHSRVVYTQSVDISWILTRNPILSYHCVLLRASKVFS